MTSSLSEISLLPLKQRNRNEDGIVPWEQEEEAEVDFSSSSPQNNKRILLPTSLESGKNFKQTNGNDAFDISINAPSAIVAAVLFFLCVVTFVVLVVLHTQSILNTPALFAIPGVLCVGSFFFVATSTKFG
jgi:hypothetical protein